ncbi:MAG: 2OG-Fe dioxygenase family protein [Steroidobacteraceae bacterium]
MTQAARQQIADAGFIQLSRSELESITGGSLEPLVTLQSTWARLPRDPYLRDGGRYRARRHSCFTLDVATGSLEQVPQRPHWQSTDYNALHGGMLRWFEPIEERVTGATAWLRVLVGLGAVFTSLEPVAKWFIEAHQFRIDTEGGLGRPTPEGAHRDGVTFVAVVLIAREGVSGGETRVFDAAGPDGVRFTMLEPWSALLLDDARVMHETTPLQPEDPQVLGHRDTLVLTYRKEGFQAP